MEIKPREGRKPFDLGMAMTLPFRTVGGTRFGVRLWLWATLAYSVILLISLPFILPFYVDYMAWLGEYMKAARAGQIPDSSGLMVAMGKVWYIFGFLFVGALAVMVSAETALHRKAQRGEGSAQRPLRLGREEFNVLLSMLGVFAVWMLAYMGGVLALVLLTVLLSFAGPLAAIVAFFGIFALLGLCIYVPIRLLPASALAVYTGAPRVLSARAVTKGRFWPLFGAWILVYLIFFVVSNIVTTLGISVIFGDASLMTKLMMGGDVGPLLDAARERLSNPLIMLFGVIFTLLSAAVGVGLYLCIAGIGSYAVLWWRGEESQTTSTFD